MPVCQSHCAHGCGRRCCWVCSWSGRWWWLSLRAMLTRRIVAATGDGARSAASRRRSSLPRHRRRFCLRPRSTHRHRRSQHWADGPSAPSHSSSSNSRLSFGTAASTRPSRRPWPRPSRPPSMCSRRPVRWPVRQSGKQTSGPARSSLSVPAAHRLNHSNLRHNRSFFLSSPRALSRQSLNSCLSSRAPR
jgi:hypothetical protein